MADVSAQEAKIGGEVRGNIKIEGYLELTASAKIVGDMEVGSLSIARGATIKGNAMLPQMKLKQLKIIIR